MIYVSSMILLKVVAVLLILFALYLCLVNICGLSENFAVRRLEQYFRTEVFPRYELSEKFREMELNRHLIPDRKEQQKRRKYQKMVAHMPRKKTGSDIVEERHSVYYLRTGQLVEEQCKAVPIQSWYGPEAWIRDILAGYADEQLMCASPQELNEKAAQARNAKKAEAAEQTQPQKSATGET